MHLDFASALNLIEIENLDAETRRQIIQFGLRLEITGYMVSHGMVDLQIVNELAGQVRPDERRRRARNCEDDADNAVGHPRLREPRQPHDRLDTRRLIIGVIAFRTSSVGIQQTAAFPAAVFGLLCGGSFCPPQEELNMLDELMGGFAPRGRHCVASRFLVR